MTTAKPPGGPTGAPLLSGKVWASLRARAALLGLQLVRTDGADGAQRLLVEHGGLWREIRSLDDVEALVVQTARA